MLSIFGKRLKEPAVEKLRPDVSGAFYPGLFSRGGVVPSGYRRSSSEYRILEREMGDGEVSYVVQVRVNERYAWEGSIIRPAQFDSLRAAERHVAVLRARSAASTVVSERVVG